jgi:release factor glutamine methyltransferase
MPWSHIIKAKPFSMSNDDQSLDGTWTILRTLQWTADYFRRQGIPSARSTAELLLSHCLTCERIDLYLRYDQPLQADELARFRALIQRRQQREPDAYIIGNREFWSQSFQVTSDVLVPRPETECLVETALARQSDLEAIEVLELGTGSGAISVALAHERPNWRIKATDISGKALNVARRNAEHILKVEASQISFIEGSWFEPLSEYKHFFDLIVSNPPYIARKDLAGLEPEVSRFEPAIALDGGDDGLSCLKHIIQTAPDYLKPEGQLILEIGYDQADAVKTMGRQRGRYHTIQVVKDYSGQDRVACFQ